MFRRAKNNADRKPQEFTSVPGQSLPDLLGTAKTTATFVAMHDTASVGLVLAAGFEVIIVDREHGAISANHANHLVIAAHAQSAFAMIRIPEACRSEIQHGLQAGADGLLIPLVETPEQARTIVDWSEFPPDGSRGFHPLTGASRYGAVPVAEQLASARQRVVIAVQIETKRGLSAVDEIAQIDGIDLLFFGPGDMSVSLGVPPGSRMLDDALHQVVQAARRHGKHSGTFVFSAQEARTAADRGVNLLVGSADVAMLSDAAKQMCADLKGALSR